MTYTKEYKESMQKYINSLAEREKKTMDSRVTTFLVAVMNGENTEKAIEISGVGELTTDELLTGIAGVWNKNTLEAMLNYQKWIDASTQMIKTSKLVKDNIKNIKGLDNIFASMKKDDCDLPIKATIAEIKELDDALTEIEKVTENM